jgi:hypothetical protein
VNERPKMTCGFNRRCHPRCALDARDKPDRDGVSRFPPPIKKRAGDDRPS